MTDEKGVRGRLVRGVSAQALGQAANLLIQLGSVPLFLSHWGKPLYGEWLLLSTVPTYLALADMGFAGAGGTDMTMRAARGDRGDALTTYHSTWLLVGAVSLVISLVFLTAALFLPLDRWLNLSILRFADVYPLLVLLIAQVFIAQQAGMLDMAYRSDGNFAAGSLVVTGKRVAQFIALAAVLSAGGGPLNVAAIGVGVEAAGFLVMAWDVRRRSPWIRHGFGRAQAARVRLLAGPAFSSLGMLLGHALSLQGMVTVVGVVLGPSATVVFATSRTLTRLIVQAVSIVTNTVWVEMAAAFGRDDLALSRRMHRRACQAALWLGVGMGMGLLASGPFLYERWTRARVGFDPALFGILLLVAVFTSLWSVSYVVPLAANRHQKIAATYVGATAASLLLGALLTRPLGIYGAAAALLVIDAAMLAVVLRQSLTMAQDEPVGFLRAVVTPPTDLLRDLLRRFRTRAGLAGAS